MDKVKRFLQGYLVVGEPPSLAMGSVDEQRVYRFPNGYGASVVRGQMTYGGLRGLFELAPIRWEGTTWNRDENVLERDIFGHLTEGEVQTLLLQICLLPVPTD